MSHKSKKGVNTEVMYDDMAGALIGRRLNSTAGSVDYDYSEAAISFSPSGSISSDNDCVIMSVQYPHAAKTDGKIYPHIHWEQEEAAATKDVVFTLQYRIQSNNAAKTTSWTTMTATTSTDAVFTYTSGTLNQISKFKDGSSNYYIDMTGMSISSTLQFRLTRTDSNSGAVLGTFFDFHYEIDALGSRSEYVK